MSEQLFCATCKTPVHMWSEVWIIRWRCISCGREGTVDNPNPPIPKPAGRVPEKLDPASSYFSTDSLTGRERQEWYAKENAKRLADAQKGDVLKRR
jgi:hypothetical protein